LLRALYRPLLLHVLVLYAKNNYSIKLMTPKCHKHRREPARSEEGFQQYRLDVLCWVRFFARRVFKRFHSSPIKITNGYWLRAVRQHHRLE
jgi:hypothetical protein